VAEPARHPCSVELGTCRKWSQGGRWLQSPVDLQQLKY